MLGETRTVQSPNVAIANGMVRLLHDYTGRGPTHARTTIAGDLIAIVMRDTLTKGELKLVAAGNERAVLDMRRRIQGAMREEAIALVEGVTGRRVAAFMSDNHIDPDLAVESFVLVPEEDGNGVARSVGEG
jgi:uncharacterized protein YbcI